ncbi:YsaB family lipoprotein [Citrobacter amalonaticus]|nr:YsaB family lipoprotein [Citrobacter amalonaticus]
MMMKSFFPAMVILLLAGCTSSQPSPPQKAQKVKVSPTRTLDMEVLCKDQAARRYNTGTQKIDVIGFEQFQGSYEMRGYTFRKESFVCSFDADGQFLHLSMR